MTATLDHDVYVTAVSVSEIFADSTYQRDLDEPRARAMANTWDRRLAGILELSDRGEDAKPRFAVIDGQHRWAAAQKLDPPPILVANVHSGLSTAEEAALFDKLNRARKQTNAWDHWRARRAAGDQQVFDIERIAQKNGLTIAISAGDGCIACIAALEKVVKLGGAELLDETLSLIVEIWGGRRDALDAPIVHGLALVLHYLREPIDLTRLGDCLVEILPRQLKTQAVALRDLTTGALPILTAIAIMALYNRKPGRKILVSNRTFGGGSRNARSTLMPQAV
jgi:hypothetical protein